MKTMTRAIPALALASLLAACAGGAPRPPAAATAQPGAEPASLPPPVSSTPREAAAPLAALEPAPAPFAAAAKALDAAVHAQADKGFARADGYTYGMDVATLLLYAAQRKDADLYAKILAAAQPLILQNPDDPYTSGFVLWRIKGTGKPERSGAAEALWMARALWTGSQAFERADDEALALSVLDGYSRHAYVLQGVWVARRAFDFATRSFDNLSLLPAYQPDFLAQVERGHGPASIGTFAERSYQLLERAATPSRLLLPVIQPEVGANYPGAGLELYAPNSLTSLEDSCLGAEGAAAGLQKLAVGVSDFVAEAGKKGGRLRAWYNADDGTAAGDAPLSTAGHACLERVAAAIGHNAALAQLDGRLTTDLQAAAKSRAATAGPLLLAAQARGAF